MEAARLTVCFMVGLVCLGLVENAEGIELHGKNLVGNADELPIPPQDFDEAYYLTHHDELDSNIDRRTKLPPRGPALTTSDCDTVTAVPDAVQQEMKLDPFYKKYTHAYGIPIISSDIPPHGALRRACYVVRFLMADRKDLRDEMHSVHGRVGMIGLMEQTTDIPEHSSLSDFWNTRARGLGGTRGNPISTDSEENILCYGNPPDRWHREDILVHEFSHGIHLIAAKYVDPSWYERLKLAHTDAVSNNLWEKTYAITNFREYFAEGVQSYFNVEAHSWYANGVHNDISTRETLMEYDPKLYELIREIFPCENTIVDRCDDQRKRSTSPMAMDCPFLMNSARAG